MYSANTAQQKRTVTMGATAPIPPVGLTAERYELRHYASAMIQDSPNFSTELVELEPVQAGPTPTPTPPVEKQAAKQLAQAAPE